jgi:hypothetical protein
MKQIRDPSPFPLVSWVNAGTDRFDGIEEMREGHDVTCVRWPRHDVRECDWKCDDLFV